MKTASISAFIDEYHPQKDGTCAVSIRVTFDRKKKYYPTGINTTIKEFNRAMEATRRTEPEKELYKKIHDYESKAMTAAKALPIFTFAKFEEIYLTNRAAYDTVSFAFDKYISELKEENRIGTAVSYETARNSINAFTPKLKFADVTKAWLTRYENWMLKQGNGKTTVGIYLRSLRTIYNQQNIDRSLYPFGDKQGKYSIPTGRNIKKALSLEEIGKIFQYQPEPGSYEERARDYWIFLYLCNGLNVKDLCLLKKKNIDGDTLKYERAKTIRSKKESNEIVISLKPQAKDVIQKWGQKSISQEGYIFPHLQKGLTAQREREIYQQLTQNINKNMKRIAKKLELNKPITTYFARHSFATILKRTGASVEMIGELLGHSDTKTTMNYLAGFETDAIHKATDVLIPQAVNP